MAVLQVCLGNTFCSKLSWWIKSPENTNWAIAMGGSQPILEAFSNRALSRAACKPIFSFIAFTVENSQIYTTYSANSGSVLTGEMDPWCLLIGNTSSAAFWPPTHSCLQAFCSTPGNHSDELPTQETYPMSGAFQINIYQIWKQQRWLVKKKPHK